MYSQTRVSCSIFSKFSRGNIYIPPKPLAINHRAAIVVSIIAGEDVKDGNERN